MLSKGQTMLVEVETETQGGRYAAGEATEAAAAFLWKPRPIPRLRLSNTDSCLHSAGTILPTLHEQELSFTLKTTWKSPDDRPPQKVPVPLLAEMFTGHLLVSRHLSLSYGVNLNSGDCVLLPRLSRAWNSATPRVV